jgi:hypothetical protein
MTWPYNPNLPNPPDDPADDVPGMQINAASIANIINVDHVPFNVSGGGQHQQVTFNANHVPSVPTIPPVLFTNSVAGLAQLFYYSGSNSQGASQYVASGTGSTMLLGGIIVKWGNAGVPSTLNGTVVNFVNAFPNACFLVLAEAQDTASATSANTYCYARTFTQTGFNALGVNRITKTAVGITLNYIAIGY